MIGRGRPRSTGDEQTMRALLITKPFSCQELATTVREALGPYPPYPLNC